MENAYFISKQITNGLKCVHGVMSNLVMSNGDDVQPVTVEKNFIYSSSERP